MEDKIARGEGLGQLDAAALVAEFNVYRWAKLAGGGRWSAARRTRAGASA